LRRLTEIGYQVRGGSALVDADVVTALTLTRTQIGKIDKLWKNEEENLRQVLRITRFRNAAVRRKFILEHRKDAGKKLLEQLSNEQAAAFKKLQGKPFDLAGLDS
jgi:thermostable 8-oxoguanine DNA glycosylase